MNFLNNKYIYFRIIPNIIDDLSIFIIKKKIITNNDENLYSYIVFLHNKTIPINELNNELNKEEISIDFISVLETFWDLNKKKITIPGINTNLNYRNKGYASLLIVVNSIIADNHGLNTVELDDVSENFKRKNNIYINLSFKYIENGYPEMIGSNKQIIRQWEKIKFKYKLNKHTNIINTILS